MKEHEGTSFLTMMVYFLLLLGLVALIRTYGAEWMNKLGGS